MKHGFMKLSMIAVTAWLGTFAAGAAGLTNAFFAMETGIHGPPAAVAQALKDLGYAASAAATTMPRW